MTLFLCAVRLQLFYPLAFPTLWPPCNLSCRAEKYSCPCTNCQMWTSARTVRTETQPRGGGCCQRMPSLLGTWLLAAEQEPLSSAEAFLPSNHGGMPKPLCSLLSPSEEIWLSWAFSEPSHPPSLSLSQGRHISSHLIFLEPQAGFFWVGLSAVAAFAFFSLFVTHHQAILILDLGSCSQNWALDPLRAMLGGLTPTAPGGFCWWPIRCLGTCGPET